MSFQDVTRDFKEVPSLQRALEGVSPNPRGGSDSGEEWEKLAGGGTLKAPVPPQGSPVGTWAGREQQPASPIPFQQYPHHTATLSPHSGGPHSAYERGA